mmetsp:Transcript_8317/g.30688  ORF Transcript_8317/g.30688 Transcript_8317/m.30688 type:complete len:268 (+) Transcript_8317:149-952(+)
MSSPQLAQLRTGREDCEDAEIRTFVDGLISSVIDRVVEDRGHLQSGETGSPGLPAGAEAGPHDADRQAEPASSHQGVAESTKGHGEKVTRDLQQGFQAVDSEGEDRSSHAQAGADEGLNGNDTLGRAFASLDLSGGAMHGSDTHMRTDRAPGEERAEADGEASGSQPHDEGDVGQASSLLFQIAECLEVAELERSQNDALGHLTRASDQVKAFNERSAQLFGDVHQKLQLGTKSFKTIRADLEYIFKRLRALKEKLGVHETSREGTQ